jgi:hypothetical protein
VTSERARAAGDEDIHLSPNIVSETTLNVPNP